MKRKDFLKSMGLAGVGATIPASSVFSSCNSPKEENNCVLIPAETAGPFPLDLSDNTFYLRQDVREDREGVPMKLKMKIIGNANCLPMPNVRVNIWHCDKDGNYSGYGSESGTTYLRGYQVADANGEVEFLTIVPGWYNGRVCHIHFQVYVSTNYAAISQLTFDIDTINEIYNDNPSIYTKGEDPLTPATDNIFSDGYDLQVAAIMPNEEIEGYEAYLEVTIEGAGLVGVSNREKETAKYLQLEQNHPNPFQNQTNIPFVLHHPANVKLDLWNLSGQKVATVQQERYAAGRHQIEVDLSTLGLAPNSYLYQLEVENSSGTFKDCKMMTWMG